MKKITSPYKIWQDRCWDHVIRDDIDLENHIHYIYNNPVKHGYVSDPFVWKNSSITSWQRRGLYPDNLSWEEPKGSQ